jgi:hypothetical protein
MTPRIFISYRREDSAGDAGRLADHLRQRFGSAQVFLDIETIDPGTDFVQALHAALGETAVVLVVIGPRWTTLQGASGVRRLDDPDDFVRLEVETALRRNVPVVPVLVQGATLPRKEELPPPLAPLTTRQVATLDHAEFHDDAQRLCDRLARWIEPESQAPHRPLRRWWPAAAAVIAIVVGAAGYGVMRGGDVPGNRPPAVAGGVDPQADRGAESVRASAAAATTPSGNDISATEALLAEATGQVRREQFGEALVTLKRAHEAAPSSQAVARMQEDVAMTWIRSVRVESGTSTFGESIKLPLAVVDAALPGATGARRADLLAHSGWATFLMWRDGNRRLNPVGWYKDALAVEAQNPYANAMLAHWILLQENDVARAVTLFDTALRAGRAREAVRVLQWAGYSNTRTPAADAELVRLADAMRRAGERLTLRQAQTLWNQYYFAMPAGRQEERQMLLGAVPPDDHIGTLEWAFDEYAAGDDSRRMTIRYYSALLHARAGRGPRAVAELRALDKELTSRPGSLHDAVQAALQRLTAGRRGRGGS